MATDGPQTESVQKEAAARFEQMAALMELLGQNKFKVNAMAKAARTIADFTGDFAAIQSDAAGLKKLDGIGAGTADRIVELALAGTIAEHDELLAKVPEGLIAVLEVPGLGPKTVKAMWDTIGVESVDDLRAALDSGEILKVPRMGQKAADKIKESLAFLGEASKRHPVGLARPLADVLVERIKAVKGVERVAYAGSMRRGRETVGDIDILCVAKDPAAAHESLKTADGVRTVMAAGETKTSVRIDLPDDLGRWKGFLGEEHATVQVDLRTVPAESWGAALMYFTGSKAHNVKLRERALKRGLTLNEYGLFPHDPDAEGSPQSRGVEPVAGATEEEVFAALDLAYVPPEMREDIGEVTLADTDAPDSELPGLVEVGDIRAELHAHTAASDGRMPLEELVRRAHERGFHTIAVTDHSKSSATAGGLDEGRLKQQRAEIETHRAALKDAGTEITVWCGSEVDILADGSLDYDDDVLHALDWIVASPHTALSQKPAEATKRLLRAIEHPMTHVIGHPTGRIMNRRKGLEPAMHEIIAAAKEHDTALEINCHWLRLDLRDTHVHAAVEAGVKIAIDCDVHTAECFDNLRYGVATGRRGTLPAGLCINTWPAEKLDEWRASKR